MSRIKTDDLDDSLKKKKENYDIRVTTFIRGRIKNRFLDDCIKRGFNESKMAGIVMETYYSVMDVYPDLKGKEPNAIQKFIIDRIKFD